MFSVIILSVVLIGVSFFWALDMNKAAKSSKGFACTFATVFSDIQNGYKDDKITFVGIGGFKYMLQSLRDDVTGLRENKDVTYLDNIINRNFPQAKTDLQTSLDRYYQDYKDKKITTCQTGDSLPDVTPGVVGGLTSQINDGVKNETASLLKVGNSLHETSKTVRGLVQKLDGDIINVYDTGLKMVGDAIKGLETAKKAVAKSLRFDKATGYIKTFLYFFTFGIFGLVLFNLFVMFMTMKLKKWLWMNCLSNVIMSCMCLFGAVVSLVAVISMIVSVLFINGCQFSDNILNDQKFAKDLLDPKTNQFALNCLYKDSSGDISFFFGNSSSTLMKDLNIFKDLGTFSQQISTFEGLTDSRAMTSFKENTLQKMLNYEVVDTLPEEASFNKNLENLNSKAKAIQAQDIFVLNEAKCPTDYQKSKNTDDVNTAKGSKYCMVIPKFTPSSIADRYNPNKDANAPYSALKKCTASHDNLITQMSSSLNTGPMQRFKTYLTKVKDSKVDAQALQGKMGKSAKFLGVLENGVKGVLDCRILRKEFDVFRKSLCDKDQGFAMTIALQGWLLTFIGPLLSCLGCCLCCQTRLSDRDKDKLEHGSSVIIHVQGEGKIDDTSFLSNNMDDEEF